MNVGGTARYVGELIENIPGSLLATGYVQGSEIEDPSIVKMQPIRVPHLGRKISPLRDFLAWFELTKIIRNERPEIVHTHTFKAGLIGRLVPGTHKRVHTFHGHLFEDNSFSKTQKMFIFIIEKILARRTNLLISVGQKVGADIRAKGIGSNRNWKSIAPGVETLPRIERHEARQLLNLDQESVLVGWMARVTEVKNPHLLVELARTLPTVKFVMAGGGNLLGSISAEAPKNLRVLGWADSSHFWSAIDLAISTSDNEGMPVALIEAQLAGIPIVATDVGSTAEVIENNVTGFLISRDIEQFGSAVNRLIVDHNLRLSMGKNAQARAVKEFSVQKMISLQVSAYSGVLKKLNKKAS
jgi:glycosyltransferase involved in cell wall biosynthesis